MWNVSSNPQKFESAIDWFRARVPLTKDEWKKLSYRNRRKAFTIGGVAQLDMIHDVWKELDNALEKGLHLEDFQKNITEKLVAEWGADKKKLASARAQTIIRNAHQSAYSAGRYEQMTKPAVLKARPYWMYDSVMDRMTSEICKERDGVIKEANDPWWKFNWPQLHHRCRASVRSLTRAEALRRGITALNKVLPKPGKGFGLIPTENEWQPDPKKYPKPLYDAWKKKLERIAKDEGATPTRAEAIAKAIVSWERAGVKAVTDAKYFTKPGYKDGVAAFVPSKETIFINPNNMFWDDVGKFTREAGDGEFFSTNDPRHIIRHELAHAKLWAANKEHYIELDNTPVPRYLKKPLEGFVSRYALQGNQLDFVAEVYAGLKAGKRFDKGIMSLYNRWSKGLL